MTYRKRMDSWPRAKIAEAVKRIVDGQTYRAARLSMHDGPEGKRLAKVGREPFRRYLKPLVEEAKAARARATEEGVVEVLPPAPQSIGIERAKPVVLSMILEDTRVAIPWVNTSYGALYNQALQALANAKAAGGPDDEFKALELLRRVLNDMAESKGMRRLSDQALISVLLQMPVAAMPEGLTRELEQKVQRDALARLADDLKGVLCRDCMARLQALRSTS